MGTRTDVTVANYIKRAMRDGGKAVVQKTSTGYLFSDTYGIWHANPAVAAKVPQLMLASDKAVCIYNNREPEPYRENLTAFIERYSGGTRKRLYLTNTILDVDVFDMRVLVDDEGTEVYMDRDKLALVAEDYSALSDYEFYQQRGTEAIEVRHKRTPELFVALIMPIHRPNGNQRQRQEAA